MTAAALTGPGRQRPLTAIPCHHVGDRRLRPHCDGITATVQYGRLARCASRDARRSTVGKGQIGRRLDPRDPDEELRAVAHAQRQVREAGQALTAAPRRGSAAGTAPGPTSETHSESPDRPPSNASPP